MRLFPRYFLRNILCSFLIAAILMQSSLSALPIYSAEKNAEYSIVALLIDSDLLEVPSLKAKIERYGTQIQSQEAATKVVLVPVAPDESPWKVAKVLQKLYFQGDDTPGEINHLSGVVLIGDVPLPVVYNGEHTFVSMYPYTDFVDPLYVYNVVQERFTRNSMIASPQPEVVHGVIRPPVAKGGEYTQLLEAYFDKNTAYREGDVVYSQFDPKVFYADLPKELRVISDLDIAQYELFKKYWEDISYLRFNKHLFEQILEEMGQAYQAPAWDQIDNDGDGRVDEDPLNGRDDDGDGENCSPMEKDPVLGTFIYDTACTANPEDPDRQRYAWGDGIDNDQDGLIDEGIDEDDGEPFKGIDNDYDGRIDEDTAEDNDADGDGRVDEDPVGDENRDGWPKDKVSFLKLLENRPPWPNPFLTIPQNDDLDDKVDEDGLEDNDKDGDGLRDEDPDFEVGITLPPTAAMPDGTTKGSIMNYLQGFDNGFSEYFSTVSGQVEGTGRWQTADVDTFFTLIAKKDEAAMNTIRRFNDLFEIAINDTYVQGAQPFPLITGVGNNPNYLYGMNAGAIPNPNFCSIYNGTLSNNPSSVFVEENRTFNFQNAGDACWLVELSDFKGCGSACANVDEKNGVNLQSPKCKYIEAKLPIEDPKGTREITQIEDPEYQVGYASCYAVNIKDTATTLDSGFCARVDTYARLLPQAKTKAISSVQYHVEPTNQTLCYHSGGKYENGVCQMDDQAPQIPQAMPIDNPRYVDFYKPGPGGDVLCPGSLLETRGQIGYVRIDYPNLFQLEISSSDSEDSDTDPVQEAIEEMLATKDGDIINEVLKYLTPTGTTREKGATSQAWEDTDEMLKQQLIEALRWREMSLQEKYEQLFAEQLSPVNYSEQDTDMSYDPRLYDDIAPRKPINGYEVFYLVADGTIHDELPLDFTLEPIDSDFKNINLEKQLPIPVDATFCDGQFNKYQESLFDGRWADAMKCWLEELTVPTITFADSIDPETGAVVASPARKSDRDQDGLYDEIDEHADDADFNKDGLLDGQNALSAIKLSSDNRLVLSGSPTSTTVTASFFDGQDRFMETHSYDQVQFSVADPDIVELRSDKAQESYFGQSTIELYPGEQLGATTVTATITQDNSYPYSPQFGSTAVQHQFIRPHVYDSSGTEVTEVSATTRSPLRVAVDLYHPETGAPLTPSNNRSFQVLVTDNDPAYPRRDLTLYDLQGLPEGSTVSSACIAVPGDQQYCGDSFTITPTESSFSFELLSKGVGGQVKVIVVPKEVAPAPEGSNEAPSNITAQVWGRNAMSTAVVKLQNQRIIRSAPFQIFNTDKKVELRALSVATDTPVFSDELRAGGEETLILDATLTDAEQNSYSDISGLPVTFRITHPLSKESPASFVTDASAGTVVKEIQTTVVNGIARAVLTSTNITGEFQVEAFLTTRDTQFYPGSRTMTTFSDAIARMTLESSSQVIINGKTPATTRLSVFDRLDNLIDFPNVDLTVFLEGAITTATELPDFDGEKEGFQVPAIDLAELDIIARDSESIGNGSLVIRYTPAVEVRQDFRVIKEGTMSLELGSDILSADGRSQTTVTATLKDENGTPVQTNQAVVSFHVRDVSSGTVTQKNVAAVNGVATTTLVSGIKAGDTVVTATSFGYRSAEHPLSLIPGPPAKLQFHIEPDTIIPAAGADIAVGVYDQHGNFLSNHSGSTVTVELSEATEDKATLSPGTVAITNGVGSFRIAPTETGTLNLLASSGNLERDKVSIKSQFTLNKDFVQNLQPQTLYASLLGMPFGNAALPDNIGGWWLFSGKTQAVTAMTAPIKEASVIAKVEPNGNVFLGNAGGESYGRSLRLLQDANNTLGFELFDPGYNTSLLKFFYKLDSVLLVKATSDIPLAFDANRFYVHHLRPDLSELFEENDRMILHANERDLVSINSNGTLSILDNTVDVETVLTPGLPLQLHLKVGGETLASITLAFQNLPVVEAGTESPTGSHILVERTSTLTQHQLAPMYFGDSSSNNTALALVDVQERSTIHNHPFRGVEDVLDSGEIALGFRGDNTYLTQFAAGNTVGASTKAYAGETLINLGDPFIKLADKELIRPNTLGFSSFSMLMPDGRQYGELVTSVRSHSPFAEGSIVAGDIILAINGQTFSDSKSAKEVLAALPVTTQKVSVRFLHEGQEVTKDLILPAFTPDMGTRILPESSSELEGIYPMDTDGDGDEDLLIAQQDGYVKILENTQGSVQYRDLGYVHHVPDGLQSLSVGEFTGDALMDFIVPTSTGRFGLFRNIGNSFVREDLNLETRGDIYFAKTLEYNGDGVADIVTADDSGDVRVFLGNRGSLGEQSILVESHSLDDTHPILSEEELTDNLALYYPGSPAEFAPLKEFIKGDIMMVPYQEMGGTLNSNDPTEDNEFAQELMDYSEEYGAYPVQISSFGGSTQGLEFLPAPIANTGSIIAKKTVEFRKEFLTKGDVVTMRVTLQNTGDSDKEVKLLDRRNGVFQLQKSSVTCENCGPDADVAALSPHGDYDVFVDHITVPKGGTSTIIYTATVEGFPELDIKIGNFGLENKVSTVETPNGFTLLSTAHAQSDRVDNIIVIDPNNPPESIPAELPDEAMEYYEKENGGAEDTDELKDLFKYYSNDIDKDGIPNSVDPNPYLSNSNGVPGLVGFNQNIAALGSFAGGATSLGSYMLSMLNNALVETDQVAFKASQTIERALCSKGSGCFQMPLNYAFFVPGKGATPVPSFVLPAFAAPTTWYPMGIPTPGIWPPFWDGTTGNAAFESQIRFYISPTLTGSVGTAVCLGPHGYGMTELPSLGPVAPNANCFVFILDELMDALGIREVCETLKQSLDSTIRSAQNFVNGSTFGIATFSKNPSGGRTDYEPAKRNIRPSSFPSFLTNWADRQIDEIITKLTKLPNIYIILPDFQTTEAPVKPEFIVPTGVATPQASFQNVTEPDAMSVALTQAGTTAANLQASVNDFYDWMGTLPFLKVERRPLVLEIPWIDLNSLRLIENNLMDILADAMFEFEKFKLLLSCEPPELLLPGEEEDAALVAPDVLASLGRDVAAGLGQGLGSGQAETAEEEAPQAITTVADKVEALRKEQAAKADADIQTDPTLKAVQDAMATKQKEWAAQLARSNPELNLESTYAEIWSTHEELTAARNRLKAATTEQERSTAQSEVDTLAQQLRGKKRQYEKAQAATNICALSPQIAAFTVEYSSFVSSISENLQAIEEYKKFPSKLKSYLQWKSKYMGQIVNYVDTIINNTVGYIQDNKIIVKRWVQTIGAVQDALGTFQALLDVFLDYQTQCATCRNDRYNGMNQVIDMVSTFLPEPPIFKFKKWPDIVLDVSHIKPVTIVVPDLAIQPLPVYMPRLDGINIDFALINDFVLGLEGGGVFNLAELNFGTGAITIPELPVLPRPPVLPELPDLPPLPEIKLPYLPPAPKIPNMSGSLTSVIKLGGSILNIFCLLTNNKVAIPEWQLRRHIEDLTERRGFLPMDFLQLSWPQVPMPYVDSIRINTYVDFKLSLDQVYQIAAGTVRSINQGVTERLVSGTNDAIAKQTAQVNAITGFVNDTINTSLDAAPRALAAAIQSLYKPLAFDPTQPLYTPTGNANELYLTLPGGVPGKVTVTSPSGILLIPQEEPRGLAISHGDNRQQCVISFDSIGTPYEVTGNSCINGYSIALNQSTGELSIERKPEVEDHQFGLTGTGAVVTFTDGTALQLPISKPSTVSITTDTFDGHNALLFRDSGSNHGLALYYDSTKQPVFLPLARYRDLRMKYDLSFGNNQLNISARPELDGFSYVLDPRNPYLDVYNESDNSMVRYFLRLPGNFQLAPSYYNGQSVLELTRDETGDQLLLTLDHERTLTTDNVVSQRDLRVSYQLSVADNVLTITPRDSLQSNWYLLPDPQTLEVQFSIDNRSARYTVVLPEGFRLNTETENGMSYVQVIDSTGKELRFFWNSQQQLESWTEGVPTPLTDYRIREVGTQLIVEPVPTGSDAAEVTLLDGPLQVFDQLEQIVEQEHDIEAEQAGYRSALASAAHLPNSASLGAFYDALLDAAAPAPELAVPDTETLLADSALAPAKALRSGLTEEQEATRLLAQQVGSENFYSQETEALLAAHDMMAEEDTFLLASVTDSTLPASLVSIDESEQPTTMLSYSNQISLSQEALLQQYRQEAEDAKTQEFSDFTPTQELEGIYIYDMNRREGVPLLANTTLDTSNTVVAMSDVDLDGDEDVLYSIDGSIYLKKNRSQQARQVTYSSPPQYVDLEKFLLPYGAVVMPRLTTVDSESGTIAFTRTPDINNNGYEVTLYPALTSQDDLRLGTISSQPKPIRYYLVFSEEDRQLFVSQLGLDPAFVSVVPEKDTFEVSFSLPNSMYYASIAAIGSEGVGVPSQPILLPLSKHADKTAPMVRIAGGSEQTLSFFQELTLDASGSSDDNEVASISWDLDDTIDSDGDGDYLNDQDSLEAQVTIGPFEKQHSRLLHVTVTDEYDNTSTLPVTIHVTPPQVFIDRIDRETKSLDGHIEPRIPGVSVNIGRERNSSTSVVTPIENIPSYTTDDNGAFRIEELRFEDSILVQQRQEDGNYVTIAKVNSSTGAITELTSGLTLLVVPSTSDTPLLVEIQEAGVVLATLQYRSQPVPRVQIVESLSGLNEEGVYIQDLLSTDRITLQIMPSTSPSAANGVAIVDTATATTIGLLDTRGQFSLLDTTYQLTTTVSNDVPIFTLTAPDGTALAHFTMIL